MNSCCVRYRCFQCCLETEMMLSDDDVERITRLGVAPEFFISKRGGWLKLKNVKGRCVFHNGIGCSIYAHRPEGCGLYPLIFDEDVGCVLLDDECPHRDEFEISKKDVYRVTAFVSQLECERDQRKQNIPV